MHSVSDKARHYSQCGSSLRASVFSLLILLIRLRCRTVILSKSIKNRSEVMVLFTRSAKLGKQMDAALGSVRLKSHGPGGGR